jgi:uncharacterized protein (DUF4415 family)
MKKSIDNLKHQLAALDAMSDQDINYEDIPSVSSRPERLRGGAVGKFYRPLKVQKTLRLDADVLDQFESTGKGYQTRINAVLREAVFSSDAVLDEVRKNIEAHHFADAAKLISAMIRLRPETKPYINGRIPALVLNTLLKPSADDYSHIVVEVSKNPAWWRALEEQAADPGSFPNAVENAIEKIKELAHATKTAL